MTRRVKAGQKFQVRASDFNQMLDAAEAFARSRIPERRDPEKRAMNASIIRVVNQTGSTIPPGGVATINDVRPIPEDEPKDTAQFCRDPSALVTTSTDADYGRTAIALEPIEDDKVGRMVIDGMVAARVNVGEIWHDMADIKPGRNRFLQSSPTGTADILFRRDPQVTGEQWAVVRLNNTIPTQFFIEVPESGISAMEGTQPGKGQNCLLWRLNPDESITKVMGSDGQAKIDLLNVQPIEFERSGALELLPVFHDARTQLWILDSWRGEGSGQVIVFQIEEALYPGSNSNECEEKEYVELTSVRAKVVRRPCRAAVEGEDEDGYVEVHDDAAGGFLRNRTASDLSGKTGFATLMESDADYGYGPSCQWVITWINWFREVQSVEDVIFTSTGIRIERQNIEVWNHCDLPPEEIQATTCVDEYPNAYSNGSDPGGGGDDGDGPDGGGGGDNGDGNPDGPGGPL
ncbi:MAG: hypothetical protein AAF958_00785 [Planctomycetota bacterium]